MSDQREVEIQLPEAHELWKICMSARSEDECLQRFFYRYLIDNGANKKITLKEFFTWLFDGMKHLRQSQYNGDWSELYESIIPRIIKHVLYGDDQLRNHAVKLWKVAFTRVKDYRQFPRGTWN